MLFANLVFHRQVYFILFTQVGMEVAPHLKESLNKNFFWLSPHIQTGKRTLSEEPIDVIVTWSQIHKTQLVFQV